MILRDRIISLVFLIAALGTILSVPAFAYAADGEGCDTLQTQFNAYGGNQANAAEGLPKFCTATGILRFIINTILGLIGGITVLMIMIGGYRYITSSGNQERADKGKQTILWAAIGLAVVLMAAAIINIIINLIVNDQTF